MPRISWWEDTERFRDLDEIVERRSGTLGRKAVWLAIAAIAGATGAIRWYDATPDDRRPKLPLAKLDRMLAAQAPLPGDGEAEDHRGEALLPSSRPTVAPNAAARHRAAATGRQPSAADLPGDRPPMTEEDTTGTDEDFHIQVASLRSRKRAELLGERLRRRGHSASVQAVGLRNRGFWHSVRIGPFRSRIEAEMYRLDLEPMPGRHTFVVPRAKGPYYVQVASLRSRDAADELVAALRRHGHHAKRSRARAGDDGAWHTVRVGPFDDLAEAEAYRTDFERREDQHAVVVPFGPTTDQADPS